ncbi:MAG: hypothetical protein J6A38_05860 [Clostridia bacterium]|nr:hypothetical protein [Clostridia bacterium]
MKGNFLLYTALCFLGAILFLFIGAHSMEHKAHSPTPVIATRTLEQKVERRITKDWKRLFPYFAP